MLLSYLPICGVKTYNIREGNCCCCCFGANAAILIHLLLAAAVVELAAHLSKVLVDTGLRGRSGLSVHSFASLLNADAIWIQDAATGICNTALMPSRAL